MWEMKLAMPCSDALWSASTAQEWRRIMNDERKARAHEAHPTTLLDIVSAFVAPNTGVSTVDSRTVPLDGLGLFAVVHGIFSVAWYFKNRKIPHYWANMMHIKIEEHQDGEEDARWLLMALHEWKSRYNMFWASARYPMGYQPPSPMWSPPFRIAAAAIYDLACIWLQAPISDLQMAAGSRFAHGRPVSKQRVQQSWVRINKKTLSDDVCHHALNLVEAELLYKNEATGQPGLHSYLTDPSYPLFLPFAASSGKILGQKYKPIWTSPLPKDFEHIQNIASKIDNEIDLIDIVVSHLIEKISYLGHWDSAEGQMIPRTLEEIVNTGQGDCKDFSIAGAAILNRLGYQAKVALVERGDRYLEETTLPGVHHFNHVIVKIISPSKKTYWIDPTNKTTMAGGTYPDIADRPVLVLDPENPTYERIPPIDYKHAKVNVPGNN